MSKEERKKKREKEGCMKRAPETNGEPRQVLDLS